MSNNIIDLFQMADEIELCEIRLAENYNLVSQYCIVESCYDQCGNPKPYNFELNIDRYKPFLDKITYYKIEDKTNLRYSFDWSNEVYVRNCLINSLKKYSEEKNVKIEGDTKILFGDLDEIVNNKALEQALKSDVDLLSFTHLFNCYKLNYYAPARKWYGCILTNFFNLIQYGSFQELRKIKDNILHFEDKNNPSWHFSGVGEDAFETNLHKWRTRIEPKEKLCCKPELKDQYKMFFNKCVFEDKYFFYSDQVNRRDEDLRLNKLPLNKLPKSIQDNLDKFKHLIL
jgi:hypothetical protein